LGPSARSVVQVAIEDVEAEEEGAEGDAQVVGAEEEAFTSAHTLLNNGVNYQQKINER
jgi:hypothetical protein